ncbi:DUF3857 domain-containing protein [Chitinophaga sp. XS-30]|uniref:DUF3857 domain-containing protein n=1 Tax=Chitinophaga sp. XS-30 TaxID=2604421 RepID=UPI0011DD9E54|nr:DUF3857 domain-containing protein [Chitinophaga sp. XS-30]QEH40189.1 DUF3857 domain-containing protein [Chitinophaga sp. XS-30]
MRRYPFLLCLVLLFPALLSAQGRNFSISPAPEWLVPYQPDLNRKPDLKKISDGYYQLLFEEQRHLEQKTVYRHIIRQIVSEAGIQNGSEINAEYDPQYEKLQFHQITIRRNGKVINRLDPSRFKILQQETELSMFIYSGIYNAYYIVEDVRKGDQIEYAYSIVGENPIYKGKFSHTFYFTAYEPILNFYKSMLVSPSRKLSFKRFNDAPQPAKKNRNGLTLYEWNLQDTVQVRENTDKNLPSWYTGYPYTQVSEFANWADVAEWARQVTDMPFSGPEITVRVASLKKTAAGDKEQYILEAIRFVQDDIRYMGIEMGEYSQRPNTPEKVCKQRFGDCKDKALLLCALLRAAGIEANIVYVNTDVRDKIAGMLPSPNRFNHMITRFQTDDHTYFVDATVSYQRGKLKDRYNPAYGQALVITDTTSGLTQIPVKNTGSIFAQENITLPDTRNGIAKLVVETEYKGYHADNFRSYLSGESRNNTQQSYTNFYAGLFGDAEMTDSLIIDDNENENIIRVKEQYDISSPWKQDSLQPDVYVFNTSAHLLTDKIISTDKSRATPLAMNFPYHVKHFINIIFPENWKLDYKPLSYKKEAYEVAFGPVLFENHVSLNYEFHVLRDHIKPEEMAEYVEDMNKITELTAFRFTWRPSLAGKTTRGTPGDMNWMAFAVAFICGGLFIRGCQLFYRRSLRRQPAAHEAWNIQRGLLVIGLLVVVYPLITIIAIFDMNTFSNRAWTLLYTANPGRNISVIQLVMLMEAVIAVFMLVVGCFAAVLFFKRRDIFPRTFSFLLIFTPVIIILDYILTDFLNGTSYLASENTVFALPVMTAAFCVPYLLSSERARHTFIIPYEEEGAD